MAKGSPPQPHGIIPRAQGDGLQRIKPLSGIASGVAEWRAANRGKWRAAVSVLRQDVDARLNRTTRD